MTTIFEFKSNMWKQERSALPLYSTYASLLSNSPHQNLIFVENQKYFHIVRGAFKFPPCTVADLPAIAPNRHVLRFWQPVWRFNWKNCAKQLKSKFSPHPCNARPPRVPFPCPACHPLIKCLNLPPIFYSRPAQLTPRLLLAPCWEQIMGKAPSGNNSKCPL